MTALGGMTALEAEVGRVFFGVKPVIYKIIARGEKKCYVILFSAQA